MKELFHRVNSKEVVVGWYASSRIRGFQPILYACLDQKVSDCTSSCRFTTGTGDQLGHRDVLVQEFYESECQNPVVLYFWLR